MKFFKSRARAKRAMAIADVHVAARTDEASLRRLLRWDSEAEGEGYTSVHPWEICDDPYYRDFFRRLFNELHRPAAANLHYSLEAHWSHLVDLGVQLLLNYDADLWSAQGAAFEEDGVAVIGGLQEILELSEAAHRRDAETRDAASAVDAVLAHARQSVQ